MLRSDFVMKLMSVVLFVAVAAYIGLYLYHSATNTFKTELVVRYTLEESGQAEGYIIRNETVLTGENGTFTLMADEGVKVGAGQAVAVYYEGDSALERASEICALQMQIKEARAAQAIASSTLAAADIEDCVLALSEAIQHKNFSELTDLTYSVKNYIFTNSAAKITEDELALLELRLNNLLSESNNSQTVYAPMSGIFTSVVDGYEGVTPDALSDLTPAALQAAFVPQQISTNAFGKLVTGITWYYAAVLDSDDAQKLQDKKTATLQFTKTYYDELEMTIESIGEAVDGKCVVVFSAKRNLADTAALRMLTSEVKFTSYSGLYIPEQAIYSDDPDGSYIYLLTGLQAEKVYVEILCPAQDGYIVRDGAENGTVLREGSDIIVEGEDLYDGKVVEQ